MDRNYSKSTYKSILATIALFISLITAPISLAQESIANAVEEILTIGPAQFLDIKGHGLSAEEIDERLTRFYRDREYALLWIDENRPNAHADTLISFLNTCYIEGLNPEDYNTRILEALWERRDTLSLAKLEILLSLYLARYAADVREGRLDPRKLDPKLFATARDKEIDMEQLAIAAVTAPDLSQYLKMQAPQHRYYKALIPALARYRQIAANGGWPSIPKGPVLKLGMTDERIPDIRKRLSIEGDLPNSDLSSDNYDEPLEQAVKGFQDRHYLTPDGVIGTNTLRAMNVSAEQRVRQIIINMERWRWISRNLEGKEIFVNIAGFHLAGMQGEEVEIRMPVIVGKRYHMTPVFSDAIQYAEFNPYWNVPVSIARNEYLPQLRRDPNSLMRKHIRIFDGWGEKAKEIDPEQVDWDRVSRRQMGRYRLRQDPGPWNALGTVKFIFPNSYNVYLHDTPSHSLFQRDMRAFSHGCIRVSRPHELAVYILGGEENGWTIERVQKIIEDGERTVVNLKSTLPVHILYRTAVATGDGTVYFGEDVYGRDSILGKALFP